MPSGHARAMMTLALLLVAGGTSVVDAQADESSDEDARPDWVQPLTVEPERSPDWIRPDDGTQERNVLPEQAATVYRSQAYSLIEAHKVRAIAGLRELEARGALETDDPAVQEVLEHLVLEHLDQPTRRDGELVNDFPMVRVQALELLGTLGGAASVATIREVVLREPAESAVLATAVQEYTRTGSAMDEAIASRLLRLLERMRVSVPDNRLALAIINAVHTSHLRQWGSVPVDLYRALFDVYRGPFAPEVRARAMDVIELMRQ